MLVPVFLTDDHRLRSYRCSPSPIATATGARVQLGCQREPRDIVLQASLGMASKRATVSRQDSIGSLGAKWCLRFHGKAAYPDPAEELALRKAEARKDNRISGSA